jgi:hypothetical protein
MNENRPRAHLAIPTLLLTATLAVACGSETTGAGAPGSMRLDGGAAGPPGSARDAGPGNAPPAQATCDELPRARAATGTVLTLPIQIVAEGKPVVFGERNTLADGTAITPVNLRFYVSEPTLLGAGGKSTPADLVAADGQLVPYGVQLVNAEAPDSLSLRMRVPPGSYTGVSFTLGLSDACNRGPASMRKAPLNDASQMTWPPPFGYLFLRYEARVVRPAGRAEKPGDPVIGIHMGGLPGTVMAPIVSAAATVTVTAAPLSRPLRFSLDEVWKAIALPVQAMPGNALPLPPGAEVQAGEALRENAAKVKLFSLP